MPTSLPEHIYISGPEKPFFMEKGLYSGLKDRDGLPNPLPVTLKLNQEYTSTGFLDALPHQFLKQVGFKKILFRAIISGEAILSFYILLENKKIYHCQDFLLSDGVNQINLPDNLVNEPNGRLIFFKIKGLTDDTTIFEWSYLSGHFSDHLIKAKELTIVSRTLGDSAVLVEQFFDLHSQYQEIKKNLPGVFLLPFPSLTIYESDRTSYTDSAALIKKYSTDFITLKYNKSNLGGGGNMCLAVYEEYVTKSNQNQFIMIDSDTIIPFRTLYFSVATAALQATQQQTISTVPTILYAKKSNIILESGALFGRGNWGIASANVSQPCIAPLFHNQLISNTDTQSSISDQGYTDYPPFIYSIFNAGSKDKKVHFLPVPFFLRGDDIEMGMHLQENSIPCQVNGWLVVFQEPKHSLWHEFMAILHGTCLILADNHKNSTSRREKNLLGLREYFTTRLNCHSRALDLSGLDTYNQILDRLIKVLEFNDKDIVIKFHDPSFYLEKRKLNSRFTSSNFKTIEALKENGGINSSNIAILPFLYFETQMRDLEITDGIPDRIILTNQSNKTANIINTQEVDNAQVHEMRSNMLAKLDFLMTNSEELARKCRIISSREIVIQNYLSQFSSKASKTKKITSNHI